MPLPPPVATEGPSYEVTEGESLWVIARETLGRGDRWREIAQLNPELNPDRLRPGLRIRLPAGVSPGSPSRSESSPARPEREHVVKDGESLYTIARIYYADRNWERIYQANQDRLSRPEILRKGDRLRIPPEPQRAMR